MGLGNIKKKGEELGRKSASSFLKINMYESPQMSLDLIAHICTAAQDIDVSDCFNSYEELVLELNEKTKEMSFIDNNFIRNCYYAGADLQEKLVSDVSANLKIAVAGGYSAGKSSLLNALTGIESMLPTGIDPVSMVNTYLNCSASNKRLVVRGENIRNDIVLLNKDVLACVQHASKSKVYVASVLNKIILDIPTAKEFDGITFIDTPGYNNSSAVTNGSSQTDSDKAMNAIKQANAVFWCIDSEAGTIPNTDIQMLQRIQSELEEVPVVIFFTKMDKKRPEIEKIMRTAEAVCKRDLASMPLDIIGISSINNKVEIVSLSKDCTLSKIISLIRQDVGPTDYFKVRSHDIRIAFENEVKASNEAIQAYEEKRLKSIEEKNDLQKWYSTTKEENESIKSSVHDMLLNNYDALMKAADKRQDAFVEALDGWCDALNRELDWDGQAGFLSDTSGLHNRRNQAVNRYDKLRNRNLGYEYYEKKYREDIYNSVVKAFDNSLAEISNYRETEEQNYLSQVQNKRQEDQLISILKEYKPRLIETLKECYLICKKRIEDHNAQLQELHTDEDSDIFSAICGDNFKRFLACFSNGVDLTKCSPDGYSPMTMACKMGNNDMVKFFVEHDVDLTMRDSKGNNPLEVAVINHYKDLCEILIKADKSLVSMSRPLLELSKQNTFDEWLKKI